MAVFELYYLTLGNYLHTMEQDYLEEDQLQFLSKVVLITSNPSQLVKEP